MNKKVIFSWITLVPLVYAGIYIPIQIYIKVPAVLNGILISPIIITCFLWPFYVIYFTSSCIGSPKTKLPDKVDIYTYLTDVKCIQISKSIYEIVLYNKKLVIDMSGWIFKKTHIKDIILLYYHLHYYNKHKLKWTKCTSKKYFKGKNLNMIFELQNGKNKVIPMIKKGREKRSFFLDFKLAVRSGPLMWRNHNFCGFIYIPNYVEKFYTTLLF